MPTRHASTPTAAYGRPYYNDEIGHETRLLTRFLPQRLKTRMLYRWFLRLTRILQFISALISLAVFSARLRKVWRLVNALKVSRGVNKSYGAVEGILAAAVLYTLLAMILTLVLKLGGPRWLRWF